MTLDEAIAELRRLNEPVPKPMTLPSEAQVEAAEPELGIRFPADYRSYLLRASDVVCGAIEPATIADPTSHTHLPQMAREAWDEWEVPRDLLPICSDNADHYCLNPAGKVVFWSHHGTTEESWPNLATWIAEVWIGEG